MNDVDMAVEAARRGAAVLLEYWEQLGKEDAHTKARNDWVSAADRESERAIVDFLTQERPGDVCLGEEGGFSGPSPPAPLPASGARGDERGVAPLPARRGEGGRRPGEGRTWIIDPLDGTSNYLQHFPVWSVSIGLRDGDKMIAAVVYEPLRDLFFTAERGAGAFRNGERMHVSDQERVEGSFLATGFPFRAQKHVDDYVGIFRDVIRVAKGVRRAGSAALDLAYTAAGVFDGFFELHLATWDVAAGSLLVTEAGGLVSDFSGGDRWLERGNIVGAPPGVHTELLSMIAEHVREDQLER